MDPAVQQVVEAIVENRRRFEAFSRSLSAEELERPVPQSTWRVRDFIAHLATLDPVMERWFSGGASLGGEGSDGERASFDIDKFNEAEVVARRGWSLDQLLEEGARNRERLIAALSRLTTEDIERPMYFGGDAKRKAGTIQLKLFLAGWSQHDPIHVADMLKALPERVGDPELRAWTDNVFVRGYQQVMNRPAS